jgi:hypothetical protein
MTHIPSLPRYTIRGRSDFSFSILAPSSRYDSEFLINTVPVNYGIQFSGPANPTHRPPHPAWRRSSPNCQSAALLRYKGAFVSRRFFNSSLNLLFFLPSPARPSCLRPRRVPTFPRHPPGLHRRIPCGQSEKCLVAIAGSYSLTPSAVLSRRPSPAVGLHSAMTLANCLASRPPATCSRDGLRCSITATFLWPL